MHDLIKKMDCLNVIFIKDLEVKEFSLTRDLLLKALPSSYHTGNTEIESIIQRENGMEVQISKSDRFDESILKTGVLVGKVWYPVVEAMTHSTVTVLALNVPSYISDLQLTQCIKSHCSNIADVFQKLQADFKTFTLDVGVRKISVPVATELPTALNPMGPDGIFRKVPLWSKEMLKISDEAFVAQ